MGKKTQNNRNKKFWGLKSIFIRLEEPQIQARWGRTWLHLSNVDAGSITSLRKQGFGLLSVYLIQLSAQSRANSCYITPLRACFSSVCWDGQLLSQYNQHFPFNLFLLLQQHRCSLQVSAGDEGRKHKPNIPTGQENYCVPNMHLINFKTYCRKDKWLISIIWQTIQTNLLMSSFCTTALKCSRKVKDVIRAEVGMETHGSIIIPLQVKEKFFENPSLILQNSDLISVLLPLVFTVIYFKLSTNTLQINCT